MNIIKTFIILLIVLALTVIQTETAAAQRQKVFVPLQKKMISKSLSKLSLAQETSSIRSGMTLWIKGRLFRPSDNKGIFGREISASVQKTIVKLPFGRGKRLSFPIGRVATSSNGSFRIKYKIPSNYSGLLKIIARFGGDGKYRGSRQSLSVTVAGKKRSAYLFWHNARGPVGKTIAVNVYLKRDNSRSSRGYANKEVYLLRVRGRRFSIPHVPARIIGRGKTDTNGRANISFKLEGKPLSYDLIAHIGDIHRKNLNTVRPRASHFLNITKAKMTFLISGPSKGRIGQTLKYKIRVSRTSDRKILTGIEVWFSGKRAITNSKGEVFFDYTISSSGGLGRRLVRISAKGDDYHQEKVYQLRLTVLPNNS